MAKAYAPLAAFIFAFAGLGGLFTGDASHVVGGHAYGNVDGVTLHLTYTRDILNLLFAAAFVYAGWFANARNAQRVVLVAGVLLLLLAIAGFVIGDDESGSRSLATLHFPLAVNIFDLVAGTVAALAGLGDLAEPAGAGATTGGRI